MERKLGLSVASLLPWSLGKDGFYRSIEIAVEKSGFDGLQILPMRGWQAEATLVDWVISFEDAWNSGSFFGAIQREIYQFITRKKCAMEEKPRLYDYAIFGSREKAYERVFDFQGEFLSAIYISNGWLRNSRNYGAIELCPEMMASKFMGSILNLKSVVWDTEHVIRPGRHGELPLTTNWRDFLSKFEPEQIKLIHVKPHFPTGSELPQMLSALGKKKQKIQNAQLF